MQAILLVLERKTEQNIVTNSKYENLAQKLTSQGENFTRFGPVGFPHFFS
jgi:hypothetical protein